MTNLMLKHRPLFDPNRYRFLCITTFLIVSCAMSQSEPNLGAVYADQAVELVRKNDVQHALEHILFLEPRSRTDLIEIMEIPAHSARSPASGAAAVELGEQQVNGALRSIPEVLVGLGGFEPPTSPLSGVRSNQLSYRPKQRKALSIW